MLHPDDNSVICRKGKIYETTPSSEFEYESGLILWVCGELSESIPVSLKIYKKYFSTIDEMRNTKINDILK